MRSKLNKAVLAVFFTFLSISIMVPLAQAQNSQDTLNQYVADLQKNPADQALREKIIKLALEIKPVPVVPEEAQRFMARGTAAVKMAKNEKDFSDAAAEFEKAALAAPWFANAYYNLGIAQDKAGQYASAINSLKLYLLAAPNASDAQKVKELAYEIEYRQEKAAKESSPEAVAAQEQKKSDDWLKKLDGRRYTCPGGGGTTLVLDVKGTILVLGGIVPPNPNVQETQRCGISGRESTCSVPPPNPRIAQFWTIEDTFIISEDGNSITVRFRFNDGDMRENILLWQK